MLTFFTNTICIVRNVLLFLLQCASSLSIGGVRQFASLQLLSLKETEPTKMCFWYIVPQLLTSWTGIQDPVHFVRGWKVNVQWLKPTYILLVAINCAIHKLLTAHKDCTKLYVASDNMWFSLISFLYVYISFLSDG